MAVERIPFGPLQASGNEELAGAGQEAHNVIADSAGAILRRPGIQASPSLTDEVLSADGVDGVLTTVIGARTLASVGSGFSRSLVRLLPGSSQPLPRVGGATYVLSGDRRPVFAETEALLLVASGGPTVAKVSLPIGTFAEDLGGNPPQGSHIAANSSRLLLNNIAENLGRVSFSDVATGPATSGHETWNLGVGTAGFFTAAARPDPVLAVYENTNEVFAFGRSTVQVFAPNPQSVYFPSSTREHGCIAPYGIISVDQAFAWIDHRRRVVLGDGRTVQEISAPIQRELDEMATISDAFAYRIRLGPANIIAWTFPTDGRTFAYQPGAGWAQWSGWDGCNWQRVLINCHHQRRDTGENLVGTTTGRVGQLSLNATTDFGDPIRAYVTTGYLDRGTDRRKHCVALRMSLRRGETVSTEEPVLRVGYREDLGPWTYRDISLGSSGVTRPVVGLRSLGYYRRRQWRFEFLGGEAFALARAEEEFETLEV